MWLELRRTRKQDEWASDPGPPVTILAVSPSRRLASQDLTFKPALISLLGLFIPNGHKGSSTRRCQSGIHSPTPRTFLVAAHCSKHQAAVSKAVI
ncbi:hypothetical protein OG21DRAFT_644071 [Imleria badia]|nr:hypothetical protein OG21DRAFT_644071 [Imleria badia]